jgi:hypothetical protein
LALCDLCLCDLWLRGCSAAAGCSSPSCSIGPARWAGRGGAGPAGTGCRAARRDAAALAGPIQWPPAARACCEASFVEEDAMHATVAVPLSLRARMWLLLLFGPRSGFALQQPYMTSFSPGAGRRDPKNNINSPHQPSQDSPARAPPSHNFSSRCHAPLSRMRSALAAHREHASSPWEVTGHIDAAQQRQRGPATHEEKAG